MTGNNAVNTLIPKHGLSFSFIGISEIILDISTSFLKALGDNLGNICINKTPTMTTVGIAMIIPYNNTSPKFAFNSLAITTGPGCGGKKPCVTDKAIAIGIPIFI